MIFLLGYLLFFVFGLLALLQGKVSINKDTAIVGTPARIIGIIALMAYPVAFVIGFIHTTIWLRNNAYEDMPISASFIINGGAFLVIILAMAFVAFKARKVRRGEVPPSASRDIILEHGERPREPVWDTALCRTSVAISVVLPWNSATIAA